MKLQQKTVQTSFVNKESKSVGYLIRATTINYYPFNIILEHKPTIYKKCVIGGHLCYEPKIMPNKSTVWEARCCDGISVSLFQMIADELNFKYELYLVEDGLFGGIGENGTWNGMLGDVIYKKADIAINGFNPTKDRVKQVHFTHPYMYDNLAFVLRKPSKQMISFVNWEFVRTMESQLAVCILLSTVVSALFIVCSENVGFLIRHKPYFSTREVMTYIFGLAFQRDMGGKNPLKWGGRVAALSYAGAMTIVMTTYTAHLTAKNIQTEIVDDFKGLKDERVIIIKISLVGKRRQKDIFWTLKRRHFSILYLFILDC